MYCSGSIQFERMALAGSRVINPCLPPFRDGCGEGNVGRLAFQTAGVHEEIEVAAIVHGISVLQ